jgi:hypothetical protein
MLRKLVAVFAVTAFFVVTSCGGGTHSRGQFIGHVVGKTEEEIVSRVGKPDEVDAKDPNKPRWIYKNKTFDPDNLNAVDGRATIILERDAQGKLIGRDVLYG